MKKVTDKTFQHIGVVKEKLVFSNNIQATKSHYKSALSHIVNLPAKMCKIDAVNYVKQLTSYQDSDAQKAISEFECSDPVALALGTNKKTRADILTMRQIKLLEEA